MKISLLLKRVHSSNSRLFGCALEHFNVAVLRRSVSCDKMEGMPSDPTPTAETEMIKAYVRVCAPAIHAVDCGIRIGGGYDLWLKLNPTSAIKQVIISQAEYKADQWKERIDDAIDEINT
jgi:hypothetical protein